MADFSGEINGTASIVGLGIEGYGNGILRASAYFSSSFFIQQFLRRPDLDVVIYGMSINYPTLEPRRPYSNNIRIVETGAPVGKATISGGFASFNKDLDTLLATATISGTYVVPVIISGLGLNATATLGSSANVSNGVGVVDIVISGKKSNFVMWSKIGSASLDIDLVNDAGYMPMPFDGTILAILQLANNAVIYGEQGIAVLNPVSSPAPTFGMTHISDLGIKSKMVVSGDKKLHYYISTNNELCSLSNEGIKVLGFKHLMALLTSNAILTYVPFTRRLYIRDGVNGFILSENKLGDGPHKICSIQDGVFYTAEAYSMLDNFSFTTEVIDFENRVRKTISLVTVNTEYSGAIYVQIGYRVNADSTWAWSTARLCNNENVARVSVTGVEFKIKVYSGGTALAAKIDNLYVKYKFSDNRFNAGKPASKYQYQNIPGGTK